VIDIRKVARVVAGAALPLLGLGIGTAAPAQGTAYVSSEKDPAITLIDLATLSVKGTIPTCDRGRHIQLTRDRLIMLACSESNAADVIDPATGKSLRRIPLGDEPEAFDLSPDGASLVHVIDVDSGTVVKNVKVGKRPRRMALTPDGKELWVTNELDASVSIIATATHTVVGSLKLEVKGARSEDITPVGIQISRDGSRAFVALGRANHVAFIDVAQRKVTHLVLVGKRAWNVTLDKAEARLYVVNGLSDDVTVVDVAAARPIKSIPVGRVPYGLVVVE
jgi:YVTN family beta-propeller protein